MPLAPAAVASDATRAARRFSCQRALLSLALAAGMLAGAVPHATAAPLPDSMAAPDAAVQAAPMANALELALVDAVNADRAGNGLGPVAYDPRLLAIARRRAADQVPLPQLSHYDVAGQVVVAPLLAAARIDYELAGENLARLPGPDATAVARAEEALMRSPGHRANILQARFDALAVGAIADESGRIIFAQIFRATP